MIALLHCRFLIEILQQQSSEWDIFPIREKILIIIRVYTPGDRDQVKINNLHLTEWGDRMMG